MVFEVDNTTENLIEQLQESIKSTISTLEDGQRDLRDLIESVSDKCDDSATVEQADLILNQLSAKKDELFSDLKEQIDVIAATISEVATITLENKTVLASITEYLSRPGYKRFFKGMEAIRDETSK